MPADVWTLGRQICPGQKNHRGLVHVRSIRERLEHLAVRSPPGSCQLTNIGLDMGNGSLLLTIASPDWSTGQKIWGNGQVKYCEYLR